MCKVHMPEFYQKRITYLLRTCNNSNSQVVVESQKCGSHKGHLIIEMLSSEMSTDCIEQGHTGTTASEIEVKQGDWEEFGLKLLPNHIFKSQYLLLWKLTFICIERIYWFSIAVQQITNLGLNTTLLISSQFCGSEQHGWLDCLLRVSQSQNQGPGRATFISGNSKEEFASWFIQVIG